MYMYYVYILKSVQQEVFYKGLTTDIDRRLIEHNSGKTQSTKFIRPFELIHVGLCSELKSARKLEKYFKSGSGREIISEIYADVAELVYAQS